MILASTGNADALAAEILSRIPASRCTTAAEIGVGSGETSRRLLAARPLLRLAMVDWFRSEPGYRQWGVQNGDPHAERSDAEIEEEQRNAERVAAAHPGAELFAADSVGAASMVAARFDDWAVNGLDLVFIDADHREANVAADIRAWWPLVRPGGWLGGHDLHRFPDDGVGRAVDAFVTAGRLAGVRGDQWTWWVRKPGGAS